MSSNMPSANSRGGGRLLRLSAWIRQLDWLRFLYRRLPLHWRERVSACLVAHARARLRFPRTAAWSRSLALTDAAMGQGTPPLNDGKEANAAGLPGVNVIGYIRGQFGLGEGVRAYARALMEAGVPVSLYDVDIGLAHGWDDHSLNAWISDELPHSISLVFVNPDYWPQAMAGLGRGRLRGHRIIACWFWELERVPEDWISVIDEVDEIMVSTEFIKDAFLKVTNKPVWKVPYPLGVLMDSGLQRSDFGLPDDAFVFLASFDFNSFVRRKNPQAAIDAFAAAFPNGREKVRLIIKASNGYRHPDKLRELLGAASLDSRITVRDDVIDRAHVNALQRCCDAFVSLHRAEGLGLGLAECMAQGKPVIATAWSGNMDFMDGENACLVGYDSVLVGEGEYPHDPGSCWAQPRIDEAATWMRKLVNEPELAERIGAQAKNVSEYLSPRLAGAVLAAHVAVLAETQRENFAQ